MLHLKPEPGIGLATHLPSSNSTEEREKCLWKGRSQQGARPFKQFTSTLILCSPNSPCLVLGEHECSLDEETFEEPSEDSAAVSLFGQR